jgi:glycosidase
LVHGFKARAFRAVVALCLVVFLFAGKVDGQDAPVVRKVEPPNWWVQFQPDLMLTLTGTNLQNATVTCDSSEINVIRANSSANGHYLFLYLGIGAGSKRGDAEFHVVNSAGQTMFKVPLLARQPVAGRNQGLDANDVIYLIMPDRFANSDAGHAQSYKFRSDKANLRTYHGGDLAGIRRHLSYLRELGITAIWLTPVVKNAGPGEYHGYAAVDLYSIEPQLGTLQDYQDLVAVAHEAQMKVLFDAVPNHVGPRNPWVKDPPMPDWFHGSASNHLDNRSPLDASFYGLGDRKVSPSGFFETLEDPHTTGQMRENLTDGWFGGGRLGLPDMNTENPVVIKYLTQNSIWWAEISGLDGFRLDTYPYVSRQFWAQWNGDLLKLYPRLFTVGEVFHRDPVVTSFFVGDHRGWDGIDTRLSTVFDFPNYHALRDVLLVGAPVGEIANVLRQDSLFPHPERLVTFFGNHDTRRFMDATNATPEKLKLAFGLIVTLRGIPELYYGDEIGLPGGNDPDNRRDFPGGWPDDPQNAFTPEGRTKGQEEIFEFVKTLLGLRREHEALRGGQLWHLAVTDSAYVFLRLSGNDKLAVAFNNAAEEATLTISLRDTPVENSMACSTVFGPGHAGITGTDLRIEMPAQSISMIQLR